MKHNLLKFLGCALLALISTVTLAQTGSVTGSVMDDTGEGLTGASVILKGTTKGTITDFDGKYQLDGIPSGAQIIIISFVGFADIEHSVNITDGQTIDLGSKTMESDAIGLDEIMVIASIAIDRKTPVAVSSIKEAQIEAKIGNQEFPEILKSTPGIFATKSGGGYGDGRVNVRGFSDQNVAVLINGIPVNDMENGHVYWSNWAGLTDAASSIQVQRGMGASKVAVPSIGGTINILSKASDRRKGGYIQVGSGNNNYSKVGFSLSSGLTDDGWAFTISGAKTQGDGYIDGTQFLGFSYFTNISKQINDAHELTFTLVGAKQTHGQRFSNISLEDMEVSPQEGKLNYDWGYRDGQVVNLAFNFFHKPQMSLNHYWTISSDTELSTAAYASFGDGGGRRAQGDLGGSAKDLVRTGGQYGPIDFDYYVAQNEANPSGESLAWIAASHNSHNWYGVLSSLNHNFSDNLKLLAGLDLRSYAGKHYYEVTDLLGGQYIIKSDNVNFPNAALTEGSGRYNRDYTGHVLWLGLFAQVEYSMDKLDAFVSVSGSNTGYFKEDFQRYLTTDPNRESDKLGYLGYQLKGGANYNLTDNHNVYFNAGFLTKAPEWDNVFAQGDQSTEVNEDAVNEDVITFEIGYGLRQSNLKANLNVYMTQWMNRALQQSRAGADGTFFYANILGVDALHQGLELDANYKVNNRLELTGMFNMQDNTWQNDVENVIIRDQDGTAIGTPLSYFMSGLRVGNAAQTTAALGFDYELLEGLSVGMDYNYYDNLYANFSPTSATSPTEKLQSWKIPAYGLFDLNIAYKFEIAGLKSTVYGNINNIADTKYVADANSMTSLYSGFGTAWTVSAKVRF